MPTMILTPPCQGCPTPHQCYQTGFCQERASAENMPPGYWCVACGRLLPSDDGVIVHDDVIHPDHMTFDEEDRPQ